MVTSKTIRTTTKNKALPNNLDYALFRSVSPLDKHGREKGNFSCRDLRSLGQTQSLSLSVPAQEVQVGYMCNC